MPKQAGSLINALVGYEKGSFDLRVAMKYRDNYIDELVDPGFDRYVDTHTQWDVTAKYRFSDSWLVYAELTNLGDEPEFYYSGNRRRAFQYDEFGSTYAIGFQYNFAE